MPLYKSFLVLVLYYWLLSSKTLAGKTTRKFIGLPDSSVRQDNISTTADSKTLIIRHNLPGRIWFHESRTFWIELQLTTTEEQNNSDVKTVYKHIDNNTILLQVYKPALPVSVESSPQQNLLFVISASIGSFLVLCLAVSALLYFCYWRKRGAKKNGTEPAKEKTPEGRTMSSKRRFYEAGSSAGSPGNALTIGIVIAICTCVLQAKLSPPNVEVSVFFPSGFLRGDSRVFLNSENNNEVKVISNDSGLNIRVFDVKNASLISENQCIDKNLTCINGACDPLVGRCVCPRKMKIDRQSGDIKQCVYECDDKCSAGFYEFSSCNRTHLAVCKKCRPLCSFKEFESTPCAGKSDRQCTDISKLPQIKVSTNIVYEDRLKAMDEPPVMYTMSNLSDSRVIWLKRSTGLEIRIKVLKADFSSTFIEVEHPENDNALLSKDNISPAITKNFCSSPVPDFHKLRLKTSTEKISVKKKSPNLRCPTYDGKTPSTPQNADNELLCLGAENPLVRLFGVKSEIERFYKVEGSKECDNFKKKCDTCRESCRELARNNPLCNLTKDDDQQKKNYGEHFAYCFDCCFQENCTCPSCGCYKYETSCLNSQIPCIEVKQFKISIDPIFQKKDIFKCHVALRRLPLFQLDVTIWKRGKLLARADTSERNSSKWKDSNTTLDYGFMVVRQPSVSIISSKNNILIRGQLGKSSFDVGWYKISEEPPLSTAAKTLKVQAKEPFKINSNTWPKQKCQTLNTEAFVEVPVNSNPEHFEEFTELEASLSFENQDRVYKVFNKSSSQQVQFEVPEDRSILRYAFPETVVFNDRSFSGRLLKNRTFWTIRLSGRVASCPGSFFVKLTDQDQPNVDVYHYDIAISNVDCSFVVEFHLPSGGDTNLIDKQFIVRLTDSRKTIKLILVSPRSMPDFKLPDLDDEFDPKSLEILIPFGATTGGMFLVLICILIYGYKTRPKDKYHRDRDNDLHFRHILYVVWFVGMRLVKSFLLTLTVFSVVLSAIHYKNVQTLQEYKAFHEQQTKVETDFVKLMDTHKVQEINRQMSILEEGKVVCDRKLKQLNLYLEKHFREMKERQEDEMRRKSIIGAANDRIQRQFNATKAKFEMERKRLNKAMEEYADEINSRISKIEDKIKGSFWLKVAKALYKILNFLASIFGSGIGKPFIEWVGLHVRFSSIHMELPSFDDIFGDFSLLPEESNSGNNESTWRRHFQRDFRINVQEIPTPELNFSSPISKEKAEELLALEWIMRLYHSGVFSTILVLLDILWFVYRHSRSYQLAIVLLHGYPKIYELEKIQQQEEKKEKIKEEKLREKEQKKQAAKKTKDDKEKQQEAEVLDLEHEKVGNEDMKRVGNEDMKRVGNKDLDKDTTKKDQVKVLELDEDKWNKCNKEKDQTKPSQEANTNGEESNEDSTCKEPNSEKAIRHGLKGLDRLNTAFLKFFVKLKELNYQINSTNLVPMCVLIVIGILCVYVVIVAAKHSMNVDTLEIVGFFDLKIAPLLTMRKIVNTRITSNAFMVNQVHIPYYENRVNARIEFYRKKAKMYQAYQCAKADLHNEEYCSWASEVGETCDGVAAYNEDFLSNLTQFECDLEPVYSQRFTKFDRIRYKEVYKKALNPYVSALRGLILDTFYMILIVIGIFILIKIFGLVVFWVMMKLDLVRQVKHYKANRDLVQEASLPHCIKYPARESIKHVRPVKVSQEIREKCGPLNHEGYSTQWI